MKDTHSMTFCLRVAVPRGMDDENAAARITGLMLDKGQKKEAVHLLDHEVGVAGQAVFEAHPGTMLPADLFSTESYCRDMLMSDCKEHPRYPKAEWVGSVTARETQTGYWGWVLEQIAEEVPGQGKAVATNSPGSGRVDPEPTDDEKTRDKRVVVPIEVTVRVPESRPIEPKQAGAILACRFRAGLHDHRMFALKETLAAGDAAQRIATSLPEDDVDQDKMMADGHGGLDAEHPRYSRQQWIDNVRSGHTESGYWASVEEAFEDEDLLVTETAASPALGA